MADAAAKIDPTEALIGGRDVPGGGWSQAAREDAMARLRRMGVHCINAAPHEITTDLLNQYTELKRRELF